MLASILAVVFVFSPAAPDTTVDLGRVRRDLTGDGAPETLSLTGRGKTVDSLEVTFAITSSGRTLYETKWRMTRVVGFDAGRRTLSAAEHRARLNELSGLFFAAEKFMSPQAFLTKWRAQARGRVAQIPEFIVRDGGGDTTRARQAWDEMQAAGITVFEFSTGGDGITPIAWSARDQRFYRLLECC